MGLSSFNTSGGRCSGVSSSSSSNNDNESGPGRGRNDGGGGGAGGNGGGGVGGGGGRGGIVYVIYLTAIVVSVVRLSFQQYQLLSTASSSSSSSTTTPAPPSWSSQQRNENVPSSSSSSSSTPLTDPSVLGTSLVDTSVTDLISTATIATPESVVDGSTSSSTSTTTESFKFHNHSQDETAKPKESDNIISFIIEPPSQFLQPRVWNIWPSASDSSNSSSLVQQQQNQQQQQQQQQQQKDKRYVSFPCGDPDKYFQSVITDDKKQDHNNNSNNSNSRRIYPLGRNCRPNCPTEGLLFTKPYKTGSSTVSGIVIQISKNIAGRYYSNNNNNNNSTRPLLRPCQSSYMHGEGRKYRHRNKDTSFLLSILRHPTTRAISEFYHFHVTRRGVPATLDSFRQLIHTTSAATADDDKTKRSRTKRQRQRRGGGDDLSRRTRNFYLHHHVWNKTEQVLLNGIDDNDNDNDDNNNDHDNNVNFEAKLQQRDKYGMKNNNTNVDNNAVVLQQVAQGIIRDYDFIGITERFDESMVVLQMLLRNVTLGDILYLSAKTNGGYDDGRFLDKCFKIVSPRHNMTQGFHDYFWKNDDNDNGSQQQQSSPYHNEWSNRIKWDLELYKAVNRSLDLTIDNVLGRTKFGHQLQRFRNAQKIVQDRCAPIAKFPCSPQGQVRTPEETNCLFKDSGCAYECIDEVANELNLYSTKDDDDDDK